MVSLLFHLGPKQVGHVQDDRVHLVTRCMNGRQAGTLRFSVHWTACTNNQDHSASYGTLALPVYGGRPSALTPKAQTLRLYLDLELRLRGPTLLDHGVEESADAASNPHAHVVAVLEVLWGLLDEADALGSTGHDDGSGHKSRALRQESNGLADVEDLVTVEGSS